MPSRWIALSVSDLRIAHSYRVERVLETTPPSLLMYGTVALNLVLCEVGLLQVHYEPCLSQDMAGRLD